jgi:hypothetical protein
MVWTNTVLSAAEQLAWTRRKPYPVATNALKRRNREPVWSASGLWSDSDTGQASNRDDPNLPSWVLYDDQVHLYTSPSAAVLGTSVVHLLFDLTAGTADNQSIDNIFLGVDLTTLAATVEVDVTIADDGDFTSHVRNLLVLSPWQRSAKIIVSNIRGSFELYQNVQYMRVTFTNPGTFTTFVPKIYEAQLGRRRALGHQPRYPHDPAPRFSHTADFNADSGLDTTFAYYEGRIVWPLKLRPVSSTAIGIDEAAAVDAWFADMANGTGRMLWVDDPQGGPTVLGTPLGAGIWCKLPQDPSKENPFTGPVNREFATSLIEQPPFRVDEV